MPKDDFIEVQGTVLEVLPGSKFIVEIDDVKAKVHAHLSGKMRMNHIRILVGDRVKMEMSPYDLTKARITYRNK